MVSLPHDGADGPYSTEHFDLQSHFAMSLFGSRDDDPLLQGDPLAPVSDEEAAGEGTPSADEEPPVPSATDMGNAGPDDDRMLVYSRDEATEGAFSDLNRCLREDWRLTRVELQEDGALAFHLRREPDADVI